MSSTQTSPVASLVERMDGYASWAGAFGHPQMETDLRTAAAALAEQNTLATEVLQLRAQLETWQSGGIVIPQGMELRSTTERAALARKLEDAERAARYEADVAQQAIDQADALARRVEEFNALLAVMPSELLEEMAEAVEAGERDMFTDAEGPFVIPLWLFGMAQRVRALSSHPSGTPDHE